LLASFLLLLPCLCFPCYTGDPIEVGAIAEVFLSAASAANSALLALSSSKSWYGHAEPGAGMVGIAHSLLAQQQQVQLPIMHLRAVNPMVASMLASATGATQQSLHMPRQAGPAALAGLADGGVMPFRTGVSAFAFQVGRQGPMTKHATRLLVAARNNAHHH
jgi:acyl transferase domain-containing protein